MDHAKRWEETLARELKVDHLERVKERPLPEGFSAKLLYSGHDGWFAGATKSAALSYTWSKKSDRPDLKALSALGVWDVMFDPDLLGLSSSEIQAEAQKLNSANIRVWADQRFKLNLSNCIPVITGSPVYDQGGHKIHELALILCRVIDWAQAGAGKIAIGLRMEREFFKSISAMRALKGSVQSILESCGCPERMRDITWLSKAPWREFTAYDASSNILRNATALSAAYLAGAEVVESLPYDLLVESSVEEHARAMRLSLTTQLILQQESHLDKVQDPASGSGMMEELTLELAQKSWTLMQTLVNLSDEEQVRKLLKEAEVSWAQKQKSFNTRKITQPGVNDVPDALENRVISQRWLRDDHVRLGREFEELRFKMSSRPKPKVALVVFGDYAALQARFNFVKNVFETLGLETLDRGHAVTVAEAQQIKADIFCLIAKDEDYAVLPVLGKRCYVAGKIPKENCENIYVGQDILALLQELHLKWEKPT